MSDELAIEASGLVKSYGAVRVLDGMPGDAGSALTPAACAAGSTWPPAWSPTRR